MVKSKPLPPHRQARYNHQLCVRCGDKLAPNNRYYCIQHRKSNYYSQAAAIKRRVANNRCPTCNKPRPADDLTNYRCKSCHSTNLADTNYKRAIWIQAGLCARCGKFTVSNGYKSCLTCRVKLSAQRMAKRKAKRKLAHKPRNSN